MAPCSVVHAHCQGFIEFYGHAQQQQQQQQDQIDSPPLRIASTLLGRSALDPTIHFLASSKQDHTSHGIDTGKAENHRHKFSGGAIAGIVLGCLLVLVLLGLGVYYWRAKRAARRINSVNHEGVTEMSSSNSNSGPSPSHLHPPGTRTGKATTTSGPKNIKSNSKAWTAQPMVTFSVSSSDDPNNDLAESGVKGQTSSSTSSLSRDHLPNMGIASHSLDPYSGRLITSYNPTSAESYRMDMGLQPSPPNRSALYHPYGSSGRITPESAR